MEKKKEKGACWGQFVANSLCFSLNKTSPFSCLTDKKQPTHCKCQLTSLSPKGVKKRKKIIPAEIIPLFMPIVFTAFLFPGSSSSALASPGLRTQRHSGCWQPCRREGPFWKWGTPSGALTACFLLCTLKYLAYSCLLYSVLSLTERIPCLNHLGNTRKAQPKIEAQLKMNQFWTAIHKHLNPDLEL